MSDPQEPPDFTSCPDWGKGGRYLYDPATGKRTRIEEAPEPVPDFLESFGTEPLADETNDAPAPPAKPLKEKKHG